MPRPWLALALFFAAPVAAASLASAPAPATSQGAVLATDGRTQETIDDYVDRLTRSGKDRQNSRWAYEVCPTVIGMEKSQGEFVADRIRSLARPLDLHAGRSCNSRLIIYMSDDPDGVAKALQNLYPYSLGLDSKWGGDRFVASDQPVRWATMYSPCGAKCEFTGTRLSTVTRPDIVAMYIIVDGRQLESIRLGELADYLALVALGNPPGDHDPHSNSVLALFDGARAPGVTYQLTDYDLAFLTALYRSRRATVADWQRAIIRSDMTRLLASPTAPVLPSPGPGPHGLGEWAAAAASE